MKEYKYKGETFQIDDSGCDCSSQWEMKVSDGNNTASITSHITRNTQYMIVIPGEVQSSSQTPEEAVNNACGLLIEYRPVDLPTPEDVCKSLCEFVEKL